MSLALTSGPLRVRSHNTVVFVLRDSAGHTISCAMLRVAAEMTSMPMGISPATAQGNGSYHLHPTLSMAGTWRLDVSITLPGRPALQAAFAVSVRWA